MPHNPKMVKLKMLETKIEAQKDRKAASPSRDKRRKAKDYDSLAGALKRNLKRRKEAGSRDSAGSTLASEKRDQS